MGDRAYMSIHVYACPVDKRQALVDLVGEYLTEGDDGQELVDAPDGPLHWHAFEGEVSLGADVDLAHAIEEAFGDDLTGLVLDLQQDPRYVYLGSRQVVVNGARRSWDCTSDGDIVVPWATVDHLIRNNPTWGGLASGLREQFEADTLDALARHVEAAAAAQAVTA